MILTGFCSIFGLAAASVAEPLALGKAVPTVEGQNHKGETVKLHEAAAEGWALFFFYPKAGTGG